MSTDQLADMLLKQADLVALREKATRLGREKRRERNRRYYAKQKAMRLNNELSEFVEEVPYDS